MLTVPEPKHVQCKMMQIVVAPSIRLTEGFVASCQKTLHIQTRITVLKEIVLCKNSYVAEQSCS
jgi:hypothetical protein